MGPSRGVTFTKSSMPTTQAVQYYPSVRMAIPDLKVGYPYITAPFATFL